MKDGKVIDGQITTEVSDGTNTYTWTGNSKDGEPHGIGVIPEIGCFEFRNGTPIGPTSCN